MYMKKIICFISIVVIIIILVIFGITFKNKQLLVATNKDTYSEEQNTIESQNTIEISQEENNQNEEIKENVLEEQEKNVTVEDTKTTPTGLDKKEKDTTTESNKDNITYSQTTNTTTTNKTNVETKTNESNMPKQEIIEKNTPKNIKSYVRNTTMENTMKEYIEKNPSEYMLQYGFIIKPDPSIVNDTNEFTYTEIRVKGKIEKKFGTIRIYAQDVLLDGVYQFTECFIL